MYAIKKGLKKVNGEVVETFIREVDETGNALEVEAGTTGYRGSIRRDAGSRTYLRISVSEGDFRFSPVRNGKNRVVGVEMAACGDTALNAIAKALDFAVKVLNDQRWEVRD